MHFLVLLLAYLLRNQSTLRRVLHRFNLYAFFLQRFGQKWIRADGNATLQYLGLVVVEMVLLVLFFWLIDDFMLGALSLVLQLVIILFCFGEKPLRDEVIDYVAKLEEKDEQAAFYRAKEFVHPDVVDACRDSKQLRDCAGVGLLYEGLERDFMIVFWYLVLGPVGAVLVWLNRDVARIEKNYPIARAADSVRHWMQWIPVRLLALTFSLVGDFTNSFRHWRESVFNFELSSRALLRQSSRHAMPEVFVGDETVSAEGVSEGERARKEICALLDLLHRSRIAWLVFVGLAMLVEWPAISTLSL